ncbi:MAG: type II secretion system protein [Lentisphaeria bacterium]|nr:type II secretion system protein [Lentisphaeria bacterium]
MFTLIELLVVISIIGILAALLMPKLGASLEKSRRVTCMNNMREMTRKMALWSEDHNGGLPEARADTILFSGYLRYSWRSRVGKPGDEAMGMYAGVDINRKWPSGHDALATKTTTPKYYKDIPGADRLIACPSYPKANKNPEYNPAVGSTNPLRREYWDLDPAIPKYLGKTVLTVDGGDWSYDVKWAYPKYPYIPTSTLSGERVVFTCWVFSTFADSATDPISGMSLTGDDLNSGVPKNPLEEGFDKSFTMFGHGADGYEKVEGTWDGNGASPEISPEQAGCQGTNVGRLDGSAEFVEISKMTRYTWAPAYPNYIDAKTRRALFYTESQ